MEQLIELLKQIQDLAGVAIDALGSADKPEGAETKPGGDGPPKDGGGPPPPPGDGGGPPPPDEEKMPPK